MVDRVEMTDVLNIINNDNSLTNKGTDGLFQFTLFYHMNGFIESGKWIEEKARAYTTREAKDLLEHCLNLTSKYRHGAWGFSFQIAKPTGQFWSIGRNAIDREKHTFIVVYNEAWNIQDSPRHLRRTQIINEILGGLEA